MKTVRKLAIILAFIATIFSVNSQTVEKQRLRYEKIVGLWTNVVVSTGETTKSLFILGGTAKIDGNIRENAVIIRGDIELNGEISGDLVVITGSGKIGDNAKIGGNIINLGSVLSISPKAQVGGSKFDLLMGKLLPEIGWIFDYIRHGVFKLRPFAPQVKLCWGLALTGFILNLILVTLFPKAITACIETIKMRPVTSFAVGLVFAWIVFPILFLLLLMLGVIGIGFIILPFFTFAALIASTFGKAAIYRFVGHQVGAISGKDIIQSPVLALIAGTVVVLLVYMLPIIGLLAWTAVCTLSFGCAIVAAIGRLRGEMPPEKAQPVSSTQLSSLQSPSTASAQQGIQGGPTFPTGMEPISIQPAPETQPVQQPTPPQFPPQMQSPSAQQVIDYKLLPRVGFWLRFAATIIDFCVFIIPFAIFHGFAWVLWFLYHFLLWKWSGATIGDKIFRIKIIKENGNELDWKTSLIRALGGILSATALGVGFFWAGWSREKKAWHDYIAGTIVVKNPEKPL